jgi:two-component system OmpR family response regulator
MEHKDCILIVDDEPEIRRLLVDYLARNGFEAVAARDGR